MKKVGLTYDSKADYIFKEGDPPDANAEFDHPLTVDFIAGAIESQGFKVEKIGNGRQLLDKIKDLDVDIVFNISEGFSGRNRESQVPIILEMHGIPYVGSDALTLSLTLDKIMAKKLFIAEGLPTPKFFEVKPSDSVFNLDHLNFPLIVKPRFEGSSKGLDEAARVGNMQALGKRVDYILNTYKQPALVEEFIRGEEFTVAILGNNDSVQVMPIVQVKIEGRLKLGDMFYTFARISSDKLEYVCPAPISEDLSKKISQIATSVYKAVDCCDFGRVDFRVDEQGNPYVLEINPLPCLAKEDIFPLVAKEIGITHEQIIGRILNYALKRYNIEN
ncbi:MAG: hypothetical protein DRP74_03260 [Candidatus Omnitrophota bacterium]|nr:MAG: hypothetical protein DRP74_03260 [Candidatus Omnitrophota bacterium]